MATERRKYHRNKREVYWTSRAEAAYWSASPALQAQVVKSVRGAFQRWCSVPNWFDGKQALQGLDQNVYEWRTTQRKGGFRVLLMEDDHAYPRLLIVDIADHPGVSELVNRGDSEVSMLGALATLAPAAFTHTGPHHLLHDVEGSTEPEVPEELQGKEWLWFLSEKQAEAADALFDWVTKSPATGSLSFVTGGAGTGKTAILLCLATRLDHAGVPVQFRCSPALAKHLNAYAGVNMRALESPKPNAVVLMDDPAGPQEVTELSGQVARDNTHVIVAFDPLQWRGKRLEAQMSRLPKAPTRTLDTCYRQGENLAKQTQALVAAVHDLSSWRVDPKKVAAERRFLKALESEYLDNLKLIRPGGRVKVIPSSQARDVFLEESTSLKDRWYRWTDLPSLLLLQDSDHGVHLSKVSRSPLRGVKMLSASLDDVERFRGLEFQSVWILMQEQFYNDIQNGKTGLSSAEWEQLRDLHIALTRAKDEMLIYLWKAQWE